MVLLKMLMEIALPKMEELLVMMMTSPSGREVPLAELLRWRAKVLLPKFRFETAALRPESPLFILFLGQKLLIYQKRAPEVVWVSTTHQGAPGLPGATRWVVPTWWAPSGTY